MERPDGLSQKHKSDMVRYHGPVIAADPIDVRELPKKELIDTIPFRM